MGWRVPFAPLSSDSEEMIELRRIRAFTEAIAVMACVGNFDKTLYTLDELLDELDKIGGY